MSEWVSKSRKDQRIRSGVLNAEGEGSGKGVAVVIGNDGSKVKMEKEDRRGRSEQKQLFDVRRR